MEITEWNANNDGSIYPNLIRVNSSDLQQTIRLGEIAKIINIESKWALKSSVVIENLKHTL